MWWCCCGGCPLCAHVADCRGNPVSGAMVSFVLGATTLTAVTDSSGNACVTGAAGTWTITAELYPYYTATGTLAITCPTGGTKNLVLKEGNPSTTTTPLYITAGGHTTTLVKLFGATIWTANSFAYGTGYDGLTAGCPSGVAALTAFSVVLNAPGCWTVGYFNYYTKLGGGCTLTSSGATAIGPCGPIIGAGNSGTITSFTSSPITINGTFGATYNSNPCVITDPPFAALITGAFSVTQ